MGPVRQCHRGLSGAGVGCGRPKGRTQERGQRPPRRGEAPARASAGGAAWRRPAGGSRWRGAAGQGRRRGRQRAASPVGAGARMGRSPGVAGARTSGATGASTVATSAHDDSGVGEKNGRRGQQPKPENQGEGRGGRTAAHPRCRGTPARLGGAAVEEEVEDGGDG